jgi:hypothetical protein
MEELVDEPGGVVIVELGWATSEMRLWSSLAYFSSDMIDAMNVRTIFDFTSTIWSEKAQHVLVQVSLPGIPAHLCLSRTDILRQQEDDRAELPRDGDGVLRVEQLLLVGLAGVDELPVDDARLDREQTARTRT